MASTVGSAVIVIGADATDFKKDLNKDLDDVSKTSIGTAQKIGSGIKNALGAALGVGLGAGLLNFAKDSIKAASDVEQSFGGLDAVFKTTADKVKQWAKDAAKDVGLSQSSYATLATQLGNQFIGLGDTTDIAAGHVQDIIDRAADMASVFGGSTADAVEAFGGVMRGEYDPMQKFVGSLSDASVEAGLTAKGLDKLPPPLRDAAKKQEALRQIFEKTTPIAGNYRKELGTTEGATKTLAAETENLQAQVGKKLQDPYKEFLKFLNEKFLPSLEHDIIPGVTDALKAVVDAMTAAPGTIEKSFYDSGAAVRKGFTDQDWGAIEQGILDHIGRIGENILGAFSQIGSKLMEIDWLRGFTEKAKAGWDAFQTWMTDHSQPTFLAEWRLRVGENISGAVSDLWNGGVAIIEGLWNGITEGFSKFFHSLSEYITDYVIDPFKRLFGIESPSTLMFSFAVDIVQGLINGLVSLPGQVAGIFTNMLGWVQGIIGQLTGWLFQAAANLVAGTIDWLSKLPGLVGGIFSNMLSTVQQWGGQILAWLADAWNRAVNAARDGFERLRLAAGERITALVGEVGQVPGRIIGALADLGRQLWDAAYSAFQRLLDGAMDKLGGIGDWAGGIKDKIIDAIKRVFDIHSPSGVFADLGQNMMAGLLQGLLQSPSLLISAVKSIGGTLMDWLGGLGSRVSEFFGGLFSGVSAGAGVGAGVARWTAVAQQAMAMAGLPAQYLPLLMYRMNVESGGNPNAINLSDSNARAGHPSQGLMQTIPGTFAAYAGPLAGRGITDPLANIYAAIKYTLARYGLGGIQGAWGGHGGYALGTSSAAAGWGLVGERGPEWMRFRGGETVLPNGQVPASTGLLGPVAVYVQVDDLAKMTKIDDFIQLVERSRNDRRRVARSGGVTT